MKYKQCNKAVKKKRLINRAIVFHFYFATSLNKASYILITYYVRITTVYILGFRI